MRKIHVIICVVLSGILCVSCKETTRLTEQEQLSYEERLAGIDKSQEWLQLELSENITIDAKITPQSAYSEKLGIYEFQREVMDVDVDKLIKIINACPIEEDVTYEESSWYLIETDAPDEAWDNVKISLDIGQDGSVAEYCFSKKYNSLESVFSSLRSFHIPLTEKVRELEKTVTVVQEQFTELLGQSVCVEVYGISNENEYDTLRMECERYLGESVTRRLFETLEEVQDEKSETFYRVEIYEKVGSNLLMKELDRASYINEKNLPIPVTSYEGYDGEIFCDASNFAKLIFDGDKTLRRAYISKNIDVEEFPLREAMVVDVAQVIDYFYEKMKTSKTKILVNNIELFYSTVVKEEDGTLEDYVYPVWRIDYHMPSTNGGETLYIDAITGKELR